MALSHVAEIMLHRNVLFVSCPIYLSCQLIIKFDGYKIILHPNYSVKFGLIKRHFMEQCGKRILASDTLSLKPIKDAILSICFKEPVRTAQ